MYKMKLPIGRTITDVLLTSAAISGLSYGALSVYASVCRQYQYVEALESTLRFADYEPVEHTATTDLMRGVVSSSIGVLSAVTLLYGHKKATTRRNEDL